MMLWKQIIDLIFFSFVHRRRISFQRKMDFHTIQMNGKERMAFMLLGSQDVGSLVCLWMLPILQMTSLNVGMTLAMKDTRANNIWFVWLIRPSIFYFYSKNFVNTCTGLFTSILMGRCNRKNMMVASLPPQSYSWIRLVHVKKI